MPDRPRTRITENLRQPPIVNSDCLGCGEWLCVTAGAYTGEIVCLKCGFVNVFRDSLKPIDIDTVSQTQTAALSRQCPELCTLTNPFAP